MNRLWLLPLLLIVADLLLPLTGKQVLIREQYGQAWQIGDYMIVSLKTDISGQPNTRKVQVTYCTYWTGFRTRRDVLPSLTAPVHCPGIRP